MFRWMVCFSLAFAPLLGEIKAYVTNQSGASVSVINETNDMVIATIAVGSLPTGVEVSPDGSVAYVASEGTDRIYVIDTASYNHGWGFSCECCLYSRWGQGLCDQLV
jgi:YVTN family beta-propeller protein